MEHFSNFGLLFSTSSAENWTTYRIVSVALLVATWVLLTLLLLMTTFSSKFRELFGFRTISEKDSFILGDADA